MIGKTRFRINFLNTDMPVHGTIKSTFPCFFPEYVLLNRFPGNKFKFCENKKANSLQLMLFFPVKVCIKVVFYASDRSDDLFCNLPIMI